MGGDTLRDPERPGAPVQGALSRRRLLRSGVLWGMGALTWPKRLRAAQPRIFDVLQFGAIGDGKVLDSPAIQRAIDAAAAYGAPAQVLVRGGRRYMIGTLELKGGIDFHLADDAELLLSTRREDYREDAAILARGAQGLTITGTGRLEGRARAFMTGYDKANEWWLPKDWRPKMFVLTACRDLQVREITFAEAPNWGLHLLGCEHVLVDHVTVRNLLDVPNCDGIDPDHSRHVEIRNCDIVSGDDAIVVKTSRQVMDYGPAANIHVHDCVISTQDAGLKIGTETTSDIHDILFERCEVRTSSRGMGIQLRDEGNVYGVTFRDIRFHSRFFSAPWWGHGEAISFTAIPRTPDSRIGKLHDVSVERVTGTAENSVRVCGSTESRIERVRFTDVDVTFDRTTAYPGGIFDDRPTTAQVAIEPHSTPGFSIEHADAVTLADCSVHWGPHLGESFGYALEARDTTGLKLQHFSGTPARPGLGKGVSIA